MFRLDPFTSIMSAAGRSGRVLQILSFSALCLSSVSLSAACGGDDSNDNKAAAQTSGGKGGSSAAGSGATAAAGTTAITPPAPVPCGSTMCPAPSNPLAGIANMFGGGALAGALPRPVGCCLDEAESKCGLAEMEGAMCEAPAVADKRCPPANLGMLGPLLGANSMAGCCIDNKCGQDGRIFGRGCVDNASASQMLAGIPLVSGMFMFPAAQACDAPVMSKPDDDAGVSDLDAGK